MDICNKDHGILNLGFDCDNCKTNIMNLVSGYCFIRNWIIQITTNTMSNNIYIKKEPNLL